MIRETRLPLLIRQKVFVAGDGSGWAIDDDAAAVRASLGRIGIPQARSRWAPARVIFHADRYRALRSIRMGEKLLHPRLGLSYFHGRPESSDEFARLFSRLQAVGKHVDRIRVSTVDMGNILSENGFGSRVQRIPIGVDINRFPLREGADRLRARERFGIPQDAVVVGSFQKDGDGWGEGASPKLIKGPDILVETLIELSTKVPDLLVLLTGAARGYVTRRLTAASIPWLQLPFLALTELSAAYHALDLYLVASREEGGPKAFLEALASGVRLVSTPVGQVVDLATVPDVLISTTFEAEELAFLATKALASAADPTTISRGRAIAESNSIQSQDEEWRKFFEELATARF